MGERGKNRSARDRVAKRILDHRSQQGGAMPSAVEAQREATEVARSTDAQKEAGALANPNKGRAAKTEQHHEEPRKIRKGKAPRIFIDLGRKG